jgi:hypothetical protein
MYFFFPEDAVMPASLSRCPHASLVSHHSVAWGHATAHHSFYGHKAEKKEYYSLLFQKVEGECAKKDLITA